MKALMYHGAKDVRVEDIPPPILTSGTAALVRVQMSSICGSDMHPYNNDTGRSGYSIGREAVGVVVETGDQVQEFRPGDRVIVAGSVSCGGCEQCRDGYAMLCESAACPRAFGQGMPGLGGGQAEMLEVPEADWNLHLLPVHIPDEVGIMLTDTLPMAWQAARSAKVVRGNTVAVLGLGPVGLLCVIAAFAQGAERVLAVDDASDRRAAATKLGATAIGSHNSADRLLAETGARGVDSVLDTIGSARTTAVSVSAVRRGGAVSVLGLATAAEVPFPIAMSIAKNATVSFVACSVQAQWPELFDAFWDGRIDMLRLTDLVTHRIPLADAPKAYELFAMQKDGVRKVVLLNQLRVPQPSRHGASDWAYKRTRPVGRCAAGGFHRQSRRRP
jgi:alcohol dehydrogenase